MAEDVAAVVKDCTEGLGADVVIVCAPSREAQEQAIGQARGGGVISLFASLPKGAVRYHAGQPDHPLRRAARVGASDLRPEDVTRAVQMMAADKIDWQRLITHRLPLAEIHNGLRLMQQKQSLKVLITRLADSMAGG